MCSIVNHMTFTKSDQCADWQLYNRSTPKNSCSVHFQCVTIIRQALDVRDVGGFQLISPGSNICSIGESEPIVSLNRGLFLLMIEYLKCFLGISRRFQR